jgi:hypothetical protein
MKKLITLVSTLAVTATLLVGCGEGKKENKITAQPTMVWADNTTCPITGKKFPTTEGYNAEMYSIELDGTKYEFPVFDGKAVEEFEKNKDKYIEKIKSGSEPY